METVGGRDGASSRNSTNHARMRVIAPLVAASLAASALFALPVAARGPNGNGGANANDHASGHQNNGKHNGQNKDHSNNGKHNGQKNGKGNGQDKHGDQPHDNRGTAKIHEGATEPSPVMRNEPKVCDFHVHGFKFHADQPLTLSIVGQGGPNVAGPSTYNADATTSSTGEFRVPATGSITLADGMYKLTVGTGRTAGQQGKHKVFKIDCADTNGGEDNGNTPGQPGGDNQGSNPQQPGTQPQQPGTQPQQPGTQPQQPGTQPQQPGTQPGNTNQGGFTPQQPGTNPVGGSGEQNNPVTPTKPGQLPNTAMELRSATDPLSLYAFGTILVIALGSVAAVKSRRRGVVRVR